MIPIGGIIAGAILGASAASRGQKPDFQLRGLVFAFVLVFSVMIAFGVLSEGHWGAIPAITMLLVMLLPWATCRWILIPLRRPKLAYYVGRLSAWYWAGDTRGGGLVAASLAAVRRPDASTWAWIERKRNASRELRGGAILSIAIALDARGEALRARRTLETVPLLDREGCCRAAIAMAFEWLAAEAAERGDWRMAAHWGLHPPLGSRAAVLIGRVAARIAGNPWVPGRTFSNAQLWYAWVWSFRWRALLPLVRWACTRPNAEAPDDEPTWVAATDAPHDRAIALQARAAMSGKRVGATQIAALGEAWSSALDETALESWRARARSLGARSEVLHDVRDAVEEELALLLRRTDADVGAMFDDESCPMLLRAAALRVRSEYLDALESAIEALQARLEHKQPLPTADEWNEWQAAVLAYERAFQRAGAHNRVVAFNLAHHPMCSLAVWLWNDRKEYTIAHAIFRWLLAEAVAVGDEKAIALQTSNVACKR